MPTITGTPKFAETIELAQHLDVLGLRFAKTETGIYYQLLMRNPCCRAACRRCDKKSLT